MAGLRRSISTHWKRKDRRYHCLSDPLEGKNQDESRPATWGDTGGLDVLIIPGRTRYPSDAITSSTPLEPPLVKANYLMQLSEAPTPAPVDGALDPVTPAARPSSSTISQLLPSAERDTAQFVAEYNRLASQYQLSAIGRFEEVTFGVNKTPRKNWIMDRMISRKPSTSSLNRVPHVRASLESILRLGGYSALHITSDKRRIEFYIPTALAATAQYLLKHGHVGGIFRKPGSSAVVNALYNHFAFTSAKCLEATVETTIASGELPLDIPAEPHDVASIFKKCLWDISGGILGSTALLKVLQEITATRHQGVGKTKMIALALLCLRSSQRLDLISAVFSLLSHLKHDGYPADLERMSSRALAVVFAPLMLGDMITEVDCDAPQASPSKRSIFQFAKSKHAQMADQANALDIEKKRMELCSDLAELLIMSWNDIARQMYRLETVLHKPLPTPNAIFKENIRAIRSSPLTFMRPSERVRDTQQCPVAPVRYRRASSSGLSNIFVSPIAEVSSIYERTPARSASLHDGPSPHMPEMGLMRQLPHSATAVDLRAGIRWPSMHAIAPYHSKHAHSVTELPWWERPESQSSPIQPSTNLKRHLSIRDNPSAAVFSRAASASTSIGTSPDPILGADPVDSPTVPQLAFTVAASDGIAGPQTMTNESVSTDHLYSTPFHDAMNRPSNSPSRVSSYPTSGESSRSGSQRIRVSALYMKILHLEERLQARDDENRALRAQISALTGPKNGNDTHVPSSADVRRKYDAEVRTRHAFLMTRPRVVSSADSGWEEGTHLRDKRSTRTSTSEY